MEHAHSRTAAAGPSRRLGRPTRHQLELRLDADPFWMSSLRVLTADLAMRADFDLDSVDDLILAVDEACSALVGIATPRHTLICCFAIGAEGITVTATLAGGRWAAEPYLPTDSLGWRILTTLADDVQLVRDELPNGERAAGIRLVKQRAPGVGRAASPTQRMPP